MARGLKAAQAASKSQLRSVDAAQAKVITALPAKAKVLYRMHAVLSGVAVQTDVSNYRR